MCIKVHKYSIRAGQGARALPPRRSAPRRGPRGPEDRADRPLTLALRGPGGVREGSGLSQTPTGRSYYLAGRDEGARARAGDTRLSKDTAHHRHGSAPRPQRRVPESAIAATRIARTPLTTLSALVALRVRRLDSAQER